MDGGVGTTPMTLRCQHTSQKGGGGGGIGNKNDC